MNTNTLMSTVSPEVSIIMPSYKMGDYILDALTSIENQTFKNWELVVVDDCAPEDGTAAIVESFREDHPSRVKFLRHPENLGVSAARNSAIAGASAPFLAFLDPDDFWGESYLENMISKMKSDPSIDLVFTERNIVDASGKFVRSDKPRVEEMSDFPRSLYRRNYINPSCVVLKKSVLPDSEPVFDTAREIQHHEDWDLWLRLLQTKAKFSYLCNATSFYRFHESAATSAHFEIINQRRLALWKKHCEDPLMAMELAIQLAELKNVHSHTVQNLRSPFFCVKHTISLFIRILFRFLG